MASLVDPAAPPMGRHAPRLGLSLALSALLGLVLGVGVAFARDAAIGIVYSESAAEDAADARSMGVIPHIEALGERPSHAALLEGRALGSFKAIASVVTHALIGDASDYRIGLTATRRGDGATVTAVGLAAALAASGRGVVVVDMNLRHPGVHQCFGVDGTRGVAQILEGSCSPADALVDTPIKGLRIIPAGDGSANWAEAITADQIDSLCNEQRDDAEVVIVDLPSTCASADPLLFGSVLQSMLIVCRHESTRVKDIDTCSKRLRQSGCESRAIIFNDAPVQVRR